MNINYYNGVVSNETGKMRKVPITNQTRNILAYENKIEEVDEEIKDAEAKKKAHDIEFMMTIILTAIFALGSIAMIASMQLAGFVLGATFLPIAIYGTVVSRGCYKNKKKIAQIISELTSQKEMLTEEVENLKKNSEPLEEEVNNNYIYKIDNASKLRSEYLARRELLLNYKILRKMYKKGKIDTYFKENRVPTEAQEMILSRIK